ncbi:MAG TPA: T9SS type A sorting domain-containing protein [Flavobacteriales bacterium]|nr:T9SS type A sorting domain-containing protein [Flavobacteriales bacterium]
MRHALLPLLLPLLLSCPAQATSFSITYTGVPVQAQTAIEYAAGIWSGILESDVPIKVHVNWFPMGGLALGITFPNGRKDFATAPVPSTWYSTALANSINGSELNPGENDFDVYLNSGTSWYYGTDGNPGNSEYDLVSVALHEFGHGLGFVGVSKKEGTIGSFGLLQASDFAPLSTSFPWPELDTLPGIFDRYLKNQLDEVLTNAQNPSDFLGTAFTSNQVYWNGPIALAANGDNSIRIYAPSTYALGSSCVHLNENSYPPSSANELMTPFSGAGDSNHWPGPICIGMLRDIGWNVAPGVGIAEEYTVPSGLMVYPNPAHEMIFLSNNEHSARTTIVVSDVSGRTVLAASDVASMDVSDLAPGTYIITRTSEGQRAFGTFVKE